MSENAGVEPRPVEETEDDDEVQGHLSGELHPDPYKDDNRDF